MPAVPPYGGASSLPDSCFLLRARAACYDYCCHVQNLVVRIFASQSLSQYTLKACAGLFFMGEDYLFVNNGIPTRNKKFVYN
jgi:hypothetical protein